MGISGNRPLPSSSACQRGFTLLELLVVVVIVAVLFVLTYQGISSARDSGQRAACLSNLRQIGAAITAYAGDNGGVIPYGPKAPPFTSPANLYPSTGSPTSLISLQGGEPVALGLLLARYLSKSPMVLFCPGCDDRLDATTELNRSRTTQAQGGYYYRHAGITKLFDQSAAETEPDHVRLFQLGENRRGKPIRALVIDTIFECPPDLGDFGVKPRSNHQGKYANVLYAGGHARSFSNVDRRFTVNSTSLTQLRASFEKILTVFENADDER